MAIRHRDSTYADFAWDCLDQVEAAGDSQEYKNRAKGAPALVMDNGLLQALAFLYQKGGSARQLATHICRWLHRRDISRGDGFEDAVQALRKADGRRYMLATSETLSFLKWLRQLASARFAGGG